MPLQPLKTTLIDLAPAPIQGYWALDDPAGTAQPALTFPDSVTAGYNVISPGSQTYQEGEPYSGFGPMVSKGGSALGFQIVMPPGAIASFYLYMPTMQEDAAIPGVASSRIANASLFRFSANSNKLRQGGELLPVVIVRTSAVEYALYIGGVLFSVESNKTSLYLDLMPTHRIAHIMLWGPGVTVESLTSYLWHSGDLRRRTGAPSVAGLARVLGAKMILGQDAEMPYIPLERKLARFHTDTNVESLNLTEDCHVFDIEIRQVVSGTVHFELNVTLLLDVVFNANGTVDFDGVSGTLADASVVHIQGVVNGTTDITIIITEGITDNLILTKVVTNTFPAEGITRLDINSGVNALYQLRLDQLAQIFPPAGLFAQYPGKAPQSFSGYAEETYRQTSANNSTLVFAGGWTENGIKYEYVYPGIVDQDFPAVDQDFTLLLEVDILSTLGNPGGLTYNQAVREALPDLTKVMLLLYERNDYGGGDGLSLLLELGATTGQNTPSPLTSLTLKAASQADDYSAPTVTAADIVDIPVGKPTLIIITRTGGVTTVTTEQTMADLPVSLTGNLEEYATIHAGVMPHVFTTKRNFTRTLATWDRALTVPERQDLLRAVNGLAPVTPYKVIAGYTQIPEGTVWLLHGDSGEILNTAVVGSSGEYRMDGTVYSGKQFLITSNTAQSQVEFGGVVISPVSDTALPAPTYPADGSVGTHKANGSVSLAGINHKATVFVYKADPFELLTKTEVVGGDYVIQFDYASDVIIVEIIDTMVRQYYATPVVV